MPDFGISVLELAVSGALTTSSTVSVEVPFNCDVTDVTAVVAVAPATSALVIDIVKNVAATSIFGALGTVATQARDPQYGAAGVGQTQPGGGMGVADTVLYMEFAGNAPPDIQIGALIQIDTEILTVTAPVQGATGIVVGGVEGSSKVDNAVPVYSVGVTRASTGPAGATTAATHANGASITIVKPFIAVAARESSLSVNPPHAVTADLVEGDFLSLVLTGTFTAASGITVSVEVTPR